MNRVGVRGSLARVLDHAITRKNREKDTRSFFGALARAPSQIKLCRQPKLPPRSSRECLSRNWGSFARTIPTVRDIEHTREYSGSGASLFRLKLVEFEFRHVTRRLANRDRRRFGHPFVASMKFESERRELVEVTVSHLFYPSYPGSCLRFALALE